MNRLMTTDAELMRESGRRPDAYVEVCRRHVRDVSGWLRKQVGPSEAEDLLAETLARGWYARGRFRDPGTGSAGPWLQAIAGNVVREYRRRGAAELRARRKLGLAGAAEMAAEEEIDARLGASDDFSVIGASLGRLPEGQRAALELRVVDELGYEEIGAKQGIAAATARTRVHRALRSLRLALGGGE